MAGACLSGWPHMQSYSLELFCASSTHLFACFEPASLRAPSEKLWLCKSSPAPRLSLICKSRRLKWYGKARWADCSRAYKWISSSDFVACGTLSNSRSDRPFYLHHTFLLYLSHTFLLYFSHLHWSAPAALTKLRARKSSFQLLQTANFKLKIKPKHLELPVLLVDQLLNQILTSRLTSLLWMYPDVTHFNLFQCCLKTWQMVWDKCRQRLKWFHTQGGKVGSPGCLFTTGVWLFSHWPLYFHTSCFVINFSLLSTYQKSSPLLFKELTNSACLRWSLRALIVLELILWLNAYKHRKNCECCPVSQLIVR